MTAAIPATTISGLTALPLWQSATWEEYCVLRDQAPDEHWRLFFDENSVLVTDMGWEGIDHASYCDLFTMVLFAWFSKHPEQRFTSLGRAEEVDVERLTWEGYEFLDAARDETNWQKAKNIMQRAGGSSVSVLKPILIKILADRANETLPHLAHLS